MNWSKLKQIIECNFAPSLKGRGHLHSTRYRSAHDQEGRAWITVDKKEIFSMCTVKWEYEHYLLSKELEAANQGEQPDGGDSPLHYYRNDSAHKILKKKGLYSQYEFYKAATDFTNLSIKSALHSENNLIRAIAILDKRVGKRTLKSLCGLGSGDPLVSYLYQLRCEAEGIDESIASHCMGSAKNDPASP